MSTMRKNQTKDYYILRAFDLERQNEKLRRENQKITNSMYAILQTKEKMKEAVTAEVEKEMEELNDKLNELEEKVADEETIDAFEDERRKFLNALGLDESNWDRISWKY